MGFDLKRDPLDEEQHRDEVELPIDEEDPAQGVYHVTLQDLTKEKLRSLRFRLSVAQVTYSEIMGVRGEIEPFQGDEVAVHKHLEVLVSRGKKHLATEATFLAAQESLFSAQKELIQWGICGHRAEDFTIRGKPTPFESSPLPGPHGTGASSRMLALYEKLKLLGDLAQAVLQYHDGTLLEASEVWARSAAAKKRAEEMAKKKEQVKSSTLPPTPETSAASNGWVLPSVSE